MRLIAFLLAAILAGCASPPALESAPEPVVELSQKVFDILPAQEVWIDMADGKRMNHAVFRPDTNESVPVFINFSPYWGDTAMAGGDAFSQYMIEEYAPRGYAVVLAGIRGTGHSEGCFQIGGDLELQDMHAVVDFFANEPWSNGAIATGGKSYDSSPTNGLIAKFPHPALKGVFHVSGITDMYAYNYKGGVPYLTGPIFNTYYYLQGTDEYGVSLVGAGSHEDEDAESLARLVDDVACTELPQMQLSGVGSGVHGLKDDYWIERDWTRYIGDSDWNGSIFFVHGLQDWNVKPDHILPWIDNLPEQIRVKGWLHQAGHVYPERTDWNETMLRWMDQELKGIDSGFWQEPAWEVRSTSGNWYQHDAWPPQPFFNVEGTSSQETGWKLLDDDAPLHLSGEIVLKLRGTATGDGVITAVAYDESPDGSRQWLTEGVLRAIYQDGLDNPDVPGDFDVELHLYPFDHVLEPGHNLRIVFQETLRFAIVAQPQLDAVTVTAHQLGLPTADATLMLDQPIDMECFAC